MSRAHSLQDERTERLPAVPPARSEPSVSSSRSDHGGSTPCVPLARARRSPRRSESSNPRTTRQQMRNVRRSPCCPATAGSTPGEIAARALARSVEHRAALEHSALRCRLERPTESEENRRPRRRALGRRYSIVDAARASSLVSSTNPGSLRRLRARRRGRDRVRSSRASCFCSVSTVPASNPRTRQKHVKPSRRGVQHV